MLGRRRQIELHGMPLARACLSHAPRTGAQLFQYLFKSPSRTHAAALFSPGPPEALRSAELDDPRQACMVSRISLVRYQALPADHASHGEETASRRRAALPGG